MLVIAHDEVGVVAGETFEACDDIGGHFFIGRSKMRAAIDVVDGGREVELLHMELHSSRRFQVDSGGPPL